MTNEPEIKELDVELEEVVGTGLVGRSIARYEIETEIARGGMGMVYLARHVGLDRHVVFKVLNRELSDNPEALARFEREAKGLSQLDHPNIVTLHDFGHEGKMAYIVMEFVDGETLRHRLKRRGRLSFPELMPIMGQILSGIASAHARGVVHRDIKPSNIMLCEKHGRTDFVKVLDFGLARLATQSVEITKNKSLVGTVSYMAPELVMGKHADTRADVYSLGVMFYYLLSGQKPFVGDDEMAILYQHVNKAPEPLRDLLPKQHSVPDTVIEVIEAAMSKNKLDRPRDAASMLHLMLEDGSLPSGVGWSGEFTPSALRFDSGEFGAARFQTGEASGSEVSVLSNQVAELSTRMKRTSHALRIAVILLILVVGATVFAFLSSSAPEPIDASAKIGHIEKLMNEENFLDAEAALGTLETSRLEESQRTEVARLQRELATAKLLATAKQYQTSGDRQKALETFREVLAMDPQNSAAAEHIRELSTSKPSDPTLQVSSTPSKAEFYVDGRFIGRTPLELSVAPGKHIVTLRADGFEEHEKRIELEPDDTRELSVALTKADEEPEQTTRRRPQRNTRSRPKKSERSKSAVAAKNEPTAPPPKSDDEQQEKETSKSSGGMFDKTDDRPSMFGPAEKSKKERKSGFFD